MVRCQNPQQKKFRVVVVDGFSGGGRYTCGSPGSPIIFIEELQSALEFINARRIGQSLGIVEIECLIILNDAASDAVDLLKTHIEPLIAAAKYNSPNLHLSVQYMNDRFENSYFGIKDAIHRGRYRNVLFNLDQCGHGKIGIQTINDILKSAPSAEIFYTFAIQTLITFLSRTNKSLMASQVHHLGIDPADVRALDGIVSKDFWLGAAERIVFEVFRSCARFVSPFSITNPEGWRYWLVHFANNYRARQVYNDILHENGTQAHFGRSGLDMLSYNPSEEGKLYLFEKEDRISAKMQLLEDIPRFVSESGDAMVIRDFYEAAYSATPAHKDDIHAAMLESEDLEVLTPSGGERRKISKISPDDTLRLKNQRSFFTFFSSKK